MGASDRPTLAVIGAGGWGTFHADNAVRSEFWDVVAYIDRNPDVLSRLQNERGIAPSRCFPSTQEAFAGGYPDAVTLTIPNPGRVPLLIELLNAGVWVLADKPLAHTVDDVRAIGNALRAGAGMLMIGQNYRFDPDVRAMREIIASGCLGKLEHVTVTFAINARFAANGFCKDLEGGTLLVTEMSVHHFDMMRYLFGCDAVDVYGRSWPSQSGWIKGHTGAQALLTFENGVRVTYDADWNTHGTLTDWGANWTLQFTDATIHWKARTAEPPVIMTKNPDINTDIWPGIVSKYPSHDNFMGLAFNEFTEAFGAKRAPECAFEDNVKSLAVSLGLLESARQGCPVRVSSAVSGM